MSFARPRSPRPRTRSPLPRYTPDSDDESPAAASSAGAHVAAAASSAVKARPATAVVRHRSPERAAASRRADSVHVSPTRTQPPHTQAWHTPAIRDVAFVDQMSGGVGKRRTRPATAPYMRALSAADLRDSKATFAPVGPTIGIRDVLQHADAQRAYSAGGTRNRFPSHAPFGGLAVGGAVGPGSYASDRRPEKHSPAFTYAAARDGPDPTGAGGHATSAATEKVIAAIRAGGSAGGTFGELSSIEYMAPRVVLKRELRGPLIAKQFASTHASHSREEQLKAQLATLTAAPPTPFVHLRPADSSFTAANALLRGARLGGGSDRDYRTRLPDPSGPTMSSSIRPDWSRLQLYVPAAVGGVAHSFGAGRLDSVDPETGTTMFSQARIKLLRAQGVDIKNHVLDNRAAQRAMTRASKLERLEQLNREREEKQARVAAHQAERARLARERFEEDTRAKDPAVRAQMRAALREQQERQSMQSAWLCQIVLGASCIRWSALAQRILGARKRETAARRIWLYYSRWRARQQGKIRHIERVRRLRHERASMNATDFAEALAAERSNGGGGATESGGDTPLLAPLSPVAMNLLTGGLSRVSSTQLSPRTSAQVRSQGLRHLVASRSAEAAANLILDFLRVVRYDRFRRVKEAMLSFGRAARRIQRWWRNHMLAMQWRLWIQTIQFLAFKDKCSRGGGEHMQRGGQGGQGQGKVASFNRPTHSSSSNNLTSAVAASPGKRSSTAAQRRASLPRDEGTEGKLMLPSGEVSPQRAMSPSRSRSALTMGGMGAGAGTGAGSGAPQQAWDGRNGSHMAFEDEDGSPQPLRVALQQQQQQQQQSDPSDAHSANATFASFLGSGFGSVGGGMFGGGSGGHDKQRGRHRAPFGDPAAIGENMERSSSSRMALRVCAQFVYEELESAAQAATAAIAPAGSAVAASQLARRSQGMKKFSVPHRAAGSNSVGSGPLDRHSSVVQWNVMCWLSKDVLAERMRQARVRFRHWMRAQRIQNMREELLQHSGTVKPLTREEREQLQRADGGKALLAAARLPERRTGARTSATSLVSDEDVDDYETFKRRSSLRGGTASSAAALAHMQQQATLPATSNSSDAPPPSATLSPPSSPTVQRSPSRSQLRRVQTISRVRIPSFFRLLLSDAELAAMHRGVNLLLQHPDSRWLRDNTVHSVHFIMLRPRWAQAHNAAAGMFTPWPDLSHLVPLAVGHKHALRRLAAERARAAQMEANNSVAYSSALGSPLASLPEHYSSLRVEPPHVSPHAADSHTRGRSGSFQRDRTPIASPLQSRRSVK